MGSVDIWRYNSYPTPKYPGMVYPSQVSLPYDGYDVGGGNMRNMHPLVVFFFSPFFFIHTRIFPASGQAVVTGVVPSSPPFLPSFFVAQRVQQSHCSSIFHLVLLTYALALSASQVVHKKKCPRIYTSMHSGGNELTKLTYARLEDNLIRHRGARQNTTTCVIYCFHLM